jgi:hypothetical protein
MVLPKPGEQEVLQLPEMLFPMWLLPEELEPWVA